MNHDPKKGPIWDAIQRACGELPEGYEIRLHMANGYGGIEWSAPNGDVELIHGEGFVSDDIIEALDAAKEHAGIK